MNKAEEKISELQPSEQDVIWMVGEQLKEIARESEENAEIILADLNAGMDLKKAAAELKKAADAKHRANKHSEIVITPVEADAILRKFYGLAGRKMGFEAKRQEGEIVDLFDMV